MGKLSNIQVTGCDNELYITAINSTSSTELCHLKGAAQMNSMSVDGVLAPGTYTLLMIGINWGSVTGFTIVLTIDNKPVTYNYPVQNQPAGFVWTEMVVITI